MPPQMPHLTPACILFHDYETSLNNIVWEIFKSYRCEKSVMDYFMAHFQWYTSFYAYMLHSTHTDTLCHSFDEISKQFPKNFICLTNLEWKTLQHFLLIYLIFTSVPPYMPHSTPPCLLIYLIQLHASSLHHSNPADLQMTSELIYCFHVDYAITFFFVLLNQDS